MPIPLLDLKRQLLPIRHAINEAIANVIDSTRFILGPEVVAFEEQIARYTTVSHAIGCASGSDALILALRAAGVKKGDEVITSAYSFYATAGAVWHVGARPVFIDINPKTYNLDPQYLAQNITARTKAILPVHLFGQMAEMEAILDIAGQIPVIEDSAQSLGARWKGKPTGTWGSAACISFFPSKNLGGFGDGGMILTSRQDIAERCRSLRVHGAKKTYMHEEVGYNSRLDTLQAAVLQVMLPYLDEWTDQRRRHAAYYNEAFSNTTIQTPTIHPNAESVYNQYVIQVENRDELRDRMNEASIGCAVYYPLPLPLQPCFRELGYQRGDFPHAERAAAHSLAIPVFPALTQHEMDAIIQIVLDHAATN
ncbi:DegT/DnrJ/EryC1/StrS family aminotransferase [bacterium]|nr:DegT/DnrJ/EryC1/StrS family aminotransferase [candidate division CSSED10-310 bacterium]